MLINRPSWDEHYLNLADEASTMGTCGRKKVGAVLVNPLTKEVISTGFNGSPRGLEHCTDKDAHLCQGGCLNDEGRCLKAIHAEHNAILWAKRNIEGSVMYCTDEPCENCTKYMVQTGVKKVVFRNAYPNKYNAYFKGTIEWVHYQPQLEEEKV